MWLTKIKIKTLQKLKLKPNFLESKLHVLVCFTGELSVKDRQTQRMDHYVLSALHTVEMYL